MDNKKNEPIRILHVLTAMNRAGAETMLMNLYRAIDHEHVQFDFAVTTTDKCDYDDEIEMLGGRIIHYPKYKGSNHFAYKKWLNTFFSEHSEYKIIHGHIGSTASIYLKIAKKHGRYTIAHSHSTGKMNSIRDFMYKVYSFSTRYIADYFIGCSTEALISRYGRKVADDNSKSIVLNNGIDIRKYAYSEQVRNEMLNDFNLSNNSFIVGTVGRLTEAKNPFFIVDILEELKQVEPDFRFIWAGNGELKERVTDYINKKKLNDNILMLGVRDDIPRILQLLNVFILPSVFEGLPVIGVEVQAAGVPMLCSDKVSKEVKLSNCVSFLPINSTTVWVESILKEKEFRRIENAPGDVAESGYDIIQTAGWLQTFYESRV